MNPQELPPEVHESLETFARKLSDYGTKEARVRWPYYTEDYARSVKNILDKLFDSKTKQRIMTVGSVHTLRAKYYQGCKYLIDHMDPTGVYLKRHQSSKLNTDLREGYIELAFKASYGELDSVPVPANTVDWRAEVMDFLEKATPGKRYHQEGLSLSSEDVAYLKGLLEPLGALFISKIEHQEILIIKDIA